MAGKTVVVTGASGYIASWIVKMLLERGNHVRGTARNPNDVRKVGHLLNLPGAAERLVLYKADLLDESAYDEVVDGADYVMHTAAPVVFDAADPMKEVVAPCVEGTLTILRAAAKAKTVKRVVYTSSTAAVTWSHRFVNRKEEDIVDESWWSDEELIKQVQVWYCLGKLQAERAAFEFVKNSQTPFDLVSIVPCATLGAQLNSNNTVSWANNEIKRILVGEDWQNDRIPDLVHTCSVDVEDVALAHILAMEDPNAEGRYLAFESSISQAQIALLLSQLYPQYTQKPDLKGMDETTFMKPAIKFSNEKIKKLGVKFTPAKEYLKKTVEGLKEIGEIQ